MTNRLFQAMLIGSTLAFSWLMMQAVHELGHVVHLWATGGTVEYVLLHPLAISYTHPGANPHPLIVASGGAIWGCAIPLVLLVLVRGTARSYAYLAAFFAGFCLVANGAYLAADAFLRGGDARELIARGTPPWLLVPFGLAAVGAGLYLINGLGPHFGLGRTGGRVDRRAAVGITLALLVLVLLEVSLSRR